ncbi:MAG: hypothetical protein MUF61_00780 [archaeon]|jgi:hypothetical protein|nr:hypothetical protein [archaeon]
MLERTKDFNFLRISLADALARRDNKKDKSIETIEQEREEVINYLMRYRALAKESYESRRAS